MVQTSARVTEQLEWQIALASQYWLGGHGIAAVGLAATVRLPSNEARGHGRGRSAFTECLSWVVGLEWQDLVGVFFGERKSYYPTIYVQASLSIRVGSREPSNTNVLKGLQKIKRPTGRRLVSPAIRPKKKKGLTPLRMTDFQAIFEHSRA